MDSSRNAVVQFKKTDRAKGVEGGFDVGSDFGKGISAFKADLKLDAEAQKAFGDGSGGFYAAVGQTLEMVGNLDIPLPEEAKKSGPPKKAEALIESAFTEANAYAKGNMALVMPAPGPVPKINLDGKMDGTSKNFNGTLNFSVDAGDQAKSAPFKTFELLITEKEALTTVKVSMAVDGKGPAADNFKQVGKNPDQLTNGIKQGLGQAGIQVEKVELSEFKDSPDVSGTLTIVLKDWRSTVSTLITAATSSSGAAQKIDGEKLKSGVSKCLEVKIDNLSIKVAVDGTVIKGSVDSKVDNVNAFLTGYYDIVGMVMDMQLKDKGDEADFGQKMALAYQSVAFEDAKKIMAAFGESTVTYKGDFKALVEAPADKDGKLGDLNVTGDFNLKFDNFKSYIDKAVAAGLPFGKNSAAKISAKVTEAGRVQASLYVYNDAKVLDYYKKILVASLKKAGAPEDQVKLVEGIELKGGQMAFTASKDGVNGIGYLESSDLTPGAKAVLAAADKNFSGDPTGFSVNGKTEKENMNIDGKFFFAKLLEGKSAAEVKEVMNAEVQEGAKPEEVKLVAVTKPEVKVPANLVAVQDDGKKLMASGGIASSIPGMPGGGKGSNGLLIFGGLIAVVVVGAGIAAGSKKG